MKQYFLILSLFLVFSDVFSQKTIKFRLSNIPDAAISKVGIRGSEYPLSWQKSIPLWGEDGDYATLIQFPDSVSTLEFKFVISTDTEELRWEGTENRIIDLSQSNDTIYSINEWDIEQVIDPSELPLLTPEMLRQDYELIEEMVLNVHPGTFRYNTKEDIQNSLDELKKTFQSPLSHGQAYLAISRLLGGIQCDHTAASFYNQNKILKSVIHWQENKLPFAFKWVDKRMIVTFSAFESIKRGQEIQSINGISTTDIGERLLQYVSADGNTNQSRWAKLEVNGYDFRWSAFDVFYPLAFPPDSKTVELTVFDFNTSNSTMIEAPWMSLKERWNKLAEEESFPKRRDDLLAFEIRESVGILKLGSFGTFGWKKLETDYKEFFAEVFQKIQDESAKNLIIDMRENNGGGDAMAEELMTYLDVDRIVIDDRVGKTRFTQFSEKLKPYCQTWGNPWYYNLEPEDVDGEYYVFAEGAQVNMKNKKKKNYFKGKTYWLTSSSNVSLAYYTAKAARRYDLGPLIGEETGGNLRGINGGQILFLRLPNSQIEIDFPVMGDFSLDDQPNQGVLPDYEVKYKPEDISLDKDPQLDFTLELINKR